MGKWIQIWYSWGAQRCPVRVPEGMNSWEYLKKLVIDDIDSYQDKAPYGCGVWLHQDDGMVEVKFLHNNTYCYYLLTPYEGSASDL